MANMPDPERIQDIILALRIKYTLTQAQVAARIGVNPSIVSMWERGERTPNSLHWGLLVENWPKIMEEHEGSSDS